MRQKTLLLLVLLPLLLKAFSVFPQNPLNIDSLDRLMARDQDAVYYSAHGDPIERPQRFVRGLIGHRKQREGQILRLLEKNVGVIPEMVEQMYAGVDRALHPAAGLSVLAHLIDLETRGVVRRDQDLWSLAA